MAVKRTHKAILGVTSSALLVFGTTSAMAAQGTPKKEVPSPEPQGIHHSLGENAIVSQWLEESETPYVKQAQVEGEFVFNQEGVTPNDELFNIFGTALTSMCSKPAVELAPNSEGVANYYLNVGGNIKKNLTIDVRELSDDSEEKLMACSCATGSPFGQAKILGVPLSSVVEMAELEDGVNTITAYGADGYGQPLPLSYALEKRAMLVYQVNGEEINTNSPDGSSLQLWMPETVAHYFTRDIARIELTQEETSPEVKPVDPCYRNKINILNYSDDCAFKAGDAITFEGVADDLGSPITSVEFSFDGGATWTIGETEGATADKWVNWQFSTSFEQKGDYKMTVRARTADGLVSPLSATLFFKVV